MSVSLMAPDFEKFMVFGVKTYPLAAYYAKTQIKSMEVIYSGTDQDSWYFSEDISNQCVDDETFISPVCRIIWET